MSRRTHRRSVSSTTSPPNARPPTTGLDRPRPHKRGDARDRATLHGARVVPSANTPKKRHPGETRRGGTRRHQRTASADVCTKFAGRKAIGAGRTEALFEMKERNLVFQKAKTKRNKKNHAPDPYLEGEYVPRKPKLKGVKEFDKKYMVFNSPVGTGGFSIVHRGRNRRTGEDVAIKVVPKAILDDESLAMLIREISISKHADHSNVVKTYDAYETHKHFFLVMELLSGGSLFDLINSGYKFTEQEIISVTHKILHALKYLHDKGITHRDVKLQNILLKHPLQRKKKKTLEFAFFGVKLADFGLASMQLAKGATHMKAGVGTPSYVAPEMYQKKRYTNKVDMWSLGIAVYAMFHRRLPWDGHGVQVIRRQVARFESVSSLNPSRWTTLSPHARSFLKQLLCKAKQRLTASEALRHNWIHRSPSMKGLPFLKEFLVSHGYLSDEVREQKQHESEESVERRSGGDDRFVGSVEEGEEVRVEGDETMVVDVQLDGADVLTSSLTDTTNSSGASDKVIQQKGDDSRDEEVRSPDSESKVLRRERAHTFKRT